MGERLEWVQIIEPKSKDIMYANLVSGECVWQMPNNAKIKRVDENQWWELFDINTQRHYYYNSISQRTVWQRPSNADVIPLAKLQMIKENQTSIDEQARMTSAISTNDPIHQQLSTTNNIPLIITSKWKQISLQGLDKTSEENKSKTSTTSTLSSTIHRSIRRLPTTALHSSTMLPGSLTTNDRTSSKTKQRIKIEKAIDKHLIKANPCSSEGSPASKQFHCIHMKTPVLFNLAVQDSDKFSTKVSLTPSPQSISSIRHQFVNPSRELLHSHEINSMSLNRSSLTRNHMRKKQPRTNPNYVHIQTRTDDGSVRSTYIRLNDSSKSPPLALSTSSSTGSSEQDSILDCSHSYSNDSNGYFPSDETLSTDRTHDLDKNEFNLHRTALGMKQFITYTDVIHRKNPSSITNSKTITTADPSTVSSPIYSDDHSYSFSLSKSLEPTSMNRSNEGHSDESSSCLTRSASIQLNSFHHEKENLQATIYQQFRSSPSTGPVIGRKTSNIFIDIEPDMLNIHSHKRGLFGKRLTQQNLLSWSKESITKPLLRSLDKILKREAPDLFKLIQIYMGDRKSKQNASLNICLELTTKGWSLPSIRDELYLQLIKQTNENPNVESLQRGWELIAICLSFFPPSVKFQSLVERYISLQTTMETNIGEVPISIYAKVCQKRLEKILQTGPKKGLKKPSYEEIELSKHTIHFPSMFGASLEEVMAMQRTRYPERNLPWIQTILSEEVLRLNGTQIEGIFRVPGDLDNVNALKVKCDQWQRPMLEDAHLPASLLKLWYRELAEPLIPSIFYEQCIVHCDNVERCLRLVQTLPDINRNVLMYLIHFLQIFITPTNVALTKMDVNNLSMVFAPNILRCTSEDAKTIFENARKEMLFVKILILHWNTDGIDGVC